MAGNRTSLWALASILLLAVGCGDACSDSAGGDGDGTGENNGGGVFIDDVGRQCVTATPCGDCDQDCRPSGNPFAGGGDTGGDGSGTGGGNGTGGDGTGSGGGGGTGGDGTGGTGTGSGGDGTGGTTGIDENVCLDIAVDLTHAIPTVALLIDQSGSMDASFGGGLNRLEAAYEALMDPVDGLVAELQGAFRIGMALYTSYDGGPTCPELSDVRPELNNYDPIDRVFSMAEPEEDTPTGEAILGVLRMFQIHPDQGRKLILLATDGEPDTCAVPDPQNGQGLAVSAAQDAYTQGVETVVLSVGDEVGEPHLEDMANAGAGLALDGSQGQAPFFKANDPAALKEQMRNIIISSRSCIFRVEGGVVDPGIVHRATVRVNGAEVKYGDPNGWTYHQNRQTCYGAKQCIELRGEACGAIQSGDTTVDGEFLCVYYDPEAGNGYGGNNNGSGTGSGTGGNGGGTGTGSGSGGPSECVAANGGCEYDGDCCSGICGGGTCVVN